MNNCLLIRTTSANELRVTARVIRRAMGTDGGDPVVPVGLFRLIVRREVMIGMGAATPVDFETMLQDIGLLRVEEITDKQVADFLGGRHGPELPVAKIDPVTPQTGDTFDWHLRACRFPEAWAKLNATDFGAIDWGSVLVGQIDTGFCEHPALGFEGGASTTVNTALDRNMFRHDTDRPDFSPNDAHDPLAGAAFEGHGTRTGSVLAGYFVRNSLNGAVNGYFGAAPKVPYVPVRISDSVFISDVQVELSQAITYLVSVRCKVITLSMGFPLILGLGVMPELRAAINVAYDSGVIFVCAAGNVVHDVVAPAALRRTIAIGGSTSLDTPWTGSSCGPQVDISAPAWQVYRATMNHDRSPTYGFGDGTSFATAMTAGAAALWLAHHGGAIQAAYTQPWQIVAAFRKILRDTARPVPGWDTANFGTGILNAEALLNATLPAAAALQPPEQQA